MELFHKLIGLLRDPGQIIEWAGYPGLTLIVFLETGALIFFLPGDSLLFMAGLYAGKGDLNLLLLQVLLIPAAVLGDATSYFIGSRTGPAIFNRPESRFFKPKHMLAAKAFYEKHGGKAIILARFMPLVRTFVPVVAGVAQMKYRRFASFNIIGAVAWVTSMTVGGYFLGQFEFVKKRIELIVVGIIFVSILPGLIAWLKAKLADRNAAAGTSGTPAATPPPEA
ncbi:MAG: VTT domain-containing protein [Myxococcales bacterium]|nr:VTT domain-containing protein [Myxococcales bacterium]